MHCSHEDTGTTCLGRTFAPQALDLAVAIHLVVLEHRKLGLLALMLDLLRSGVDLLLSFLSAATQTKHEMESRLLLYVIVGKGAAVLELLAGEDQALLIGWDAFLVCGLLEGSSNRGLEPTTYLESST